MMARNGNGGIGTSCGLTDISAPNISFGPTTKADMKQAKLRSKHLSKMRTDPKYHAGIKLKLQLATINSTTGSYANAAKKRISLPKFSWDKE
jgi:hypothetical protein